MPLSKGKSQKAFVHNLKAEMHAGKSQPQSLAIAYSMKRKAQKRAQGGMMHGSGCPCSTCMAKGGEIENMEEGVHTPIEKGSGQSHSGTTLREHGVSPIRSHEIKLKQLKQMPNPKLKGLAHGGYYDDGGIAEGIAAAGAANGGGQGNADLSRYAGKAKGGRIGSYQGPDYTEDELSDPSEESSGFVSHEGDDRKSNMPAMTEEEKRLNQRMVYADDDDPEGDLVDRIMKHRQPTFSSEARLSEGGKVANDTHQFESDFEDPNEFDDLVLRDDLESTYGEDDNAGDSLDNDQENEDREDIVSRIMKSRRKTSSFPAGYKKITGVK